MKRLFVTTFLILIAQSSHASFEGRSCKCLGEAFAAISDANCLVNEMSVIKSSGVVAESSTDTTEVCQFTTGPVDVPSEVQGDFQMKFDLKECKSIGTFTVLAQNGPALPPACNPK